MPHRLAHLPGGLDVASHVRRFRTAHRRPRPVSSGLKSGLATLRSVPDFAEPRAHAPGLTSGNYRFGGAIPPLPGNAAGYLIATSARSPAWRAGRCQPCRMVSQCLAQVPSRLVRLEVRLGYAALQVLLRRTSDLSILIHFRHLPVRLRHPGITRQYRQLPERRSARSPAWRAGRCQPRQTVPHCLARGSASLVRLEVEPGHAALQAQLRRTTVEKLGFSSGRHRPGCANPILPGNFAGHLNAASARSPF